MLNKKETEITLEKFFNECVTFWKKKGFDDKKAFELSISDIKVIQNDPFFPRGRVINEEAKLDFIRYREMDLGKEGEQK